ncbi:MAG: DUF7379 domain-containing protein, partial [Pyrinomonadaceae bacterium]
MPIKLLLPGRAVEPATPFEPDLSDFLKVEIKRAQAVDAAARGVAALPEQAFDDAEETDVIEREWTIGVRQWVSVAQLRQDLGQASSRGRGDQSVLRVTGEVPAARSGSRRSSRGALTSATDWALKGLKILRIDPAEATAKLLAPQAVRHLEDKLKPGEGLYRLSDTLDAEGTKLAARDLKGDAPYLVFVHGTASTTRGSFGRLAGTKEWDELRLRYGNRILGFQHRTLSQSPARNALDVAKLLPAGAKLHLVTHSRGGLVGEFLCLRKLDKDDLKPFRAEEAELLKELADELAAKRFQVERFVRVACPARGTVLASGRLDTYFSIILNLLGLIPALDSPVYSFVKATLLELAKRRTRADEIPGLEALMPESPTIRLLNRPTSANNRTTADLAVVAGDAQGSGLLGHLKVLATDLFYREDHDLVVNTAAMYGGQEREHGAYFFFQRGPQVDHFSYFANIETRRRVCDWLIRTEQAKQDGFQLLRPEAAADDLVIPQSRALTDSSPVVFLVPGIMGTHLEHDGDRIWLNPFRLALGGIRRLGLSNTEVKPAALVGLAYQKLVNFLHDKHRVVPFPYDWRLSVLTEGERLAEAIEEELSRVKQDRPVRIIAHSMGGLVARAMIAERPDLWEKLCRQHDGRLIMLGTPNLGSFIIPRLLLGQEKILRQLALLDFSHRLPAIVDIIRDFPGLLEMLPEGEAVPDFFDTAWWRALRQNALPAPEAEALDKARKARAALGKNLPERTVYVAGTAAETPGAVNIGDDGAINFEVLPRGDGRVLYHPETYLAKVPVYYMNAALGSMANHKESFPAVLE